MSLVLGSHPQGLLLKSNNNNNNNNNSSSSNIFLLDNDGMNNNNNLFCCVANTTSNNTGSGRGGREATINNTSGGIIKSSTAIITSTINSTTTTTATTNETRKEEPAVTTYDDDNDDDDVVVSPTKGMIDIEIAKEMNKLSVTEREQLLEEIHGVAGTMVETLEFQNQCLTLMDDAITKVPRRKRKAMDKVHFLRPTLNVTAADDDQQNNNNKFKLWFLRADNYDANLASRRLAAYYEKKLELFGESKLAKDITLGEISSEEIKVAYESGAIGILPNKDQSGRPIMFTNPSNWNFNLSPKIMIRVRWYLAMMLLQEDEAASMNGLCHVIYASKGRISSTASIRSIAEVVRQSSAMLAVFPIRMMSIHFCSNNRNPGMIGTFFSNFGKQKRLRVRMHYGSPIEMQYSLLTFGIHCNGFLFDDVSRNNHNNDNNNPSINDTTTTATTDALKDFVTRTLARRREIEAEQEMTRKQTEISSGIIRYPQENDVLIGRGSSYTEFPGNRRFHQLVESKLEAYNQAHLHKFDKTCISMNVVKSIQATDGRFLVNHIGDDGVPYWKVLDDIQARDKTSTAFRSRNAYRSKQLQQQHEEFGVGVFGDDGNHTGPLSPSSSGFSSSMLKQQLQGSRTPIKKPNKRLRRDS